jgi:hypothetical protein
MVLRRLGFIAAQLAPRPGARQALARVVTADDLPGDGWRVLDERTWRTGMSGPATGWSRRARAAGSVTAWRSFEAVPMRRWCWVQVVPLVSEADALSALGGVGNRGIRNLHARVTVVREHDVDIGAFPWAGKVWAHEQHTTEPDGSGVALMLAAVCGAYMIVVSGAGAPEWTWDEMVPVAARQAALLPALARDLPEPWFRPGPENASALECEAAAEIGTGHELSGRVLTVLARCDGCDEIAVSLDDGTFAMVHLTWARHPEPPSWPLTQRLGEYAALETAISAHQH